jgi:WD40 repeat protein
VVEVKWSNNNSYFTTGSKDGRCCFWELKDENSRPSLLSTLSVSKNLNRRKKKTFSCSYICWNCTFTHFAAGFQ